MHEQFIEEAKGIVVSLCDLTGNFVEPWLDAGYSAVLVDPQHEHTRLEGRTLKLATIIENALDDLRDVILSGKVVFVAGFPPCTDVAVSGARWWESKRKLDPYFQAKAAIVAEQCRMIGALSGAAWFFENPVSAFSKIFREPDYTFHPHQFTLLEPDDNYTKKTCLWTGNGFVMPAEQRDTTLGKPDNRIHFCSPGKDRCNIRSATPKGFSRAVFAANRKEKDADKER